MIKIVTLIYYIALMVVIMALLTCGFGFKTFQYWIVLTGMITARMCGRWEERV